MNNSFKGVFSYKVINIKNYDEVLSSTAPFMYEAFYSSLTKSNLLTDEQYAQYLNNAMMFNPHWGYLLHYNDTDVIIMVNPLVSGEIVSVPHIETKMNHSTIRFESKCMASIQYAISIRH